MNKRLEIEKKKLITELSSPGAALINQNYETYQVQKGETVYAISKKFNISVDDFYLWNPEAKLGIKTDQLLRVGLKKTINANQINTITQAGLITDTLKGEKKTMYNVGLMLPFEFNETELINIDQLIKDRQDFPLTQNIAIELYEGIKYAIDSLQSTDCKFNIQLFDTQDRDSAQIYKVIKDPAFRNLDICIGPVYSSSFKVVAETAKEQGIPIVSPLTQQNKILFENVYASKTTPSNFMLIEALAEFVADSFRTQNVVLINLGKAKEQAIIKAFKTHYNDYLYTQYNNTHDTIIEVKDIANAEGAKNIEKAKAAYHLTKKNYYLVISEDEISISDFLTQLNNFIDKKKEITVIGLKKWVTMDYIDPEYLNKFQFLYPAPYFIDYSDTLITMAAGAYRSIYFTDPEDYYFQGIDIGLYYLNALKIYGTNFYKTLDLHKERGMIMNFNFFRPSKTTGFDNKSIRMVRYKDYKYIKAN